MSHNLLGSGDFRITYSTYDLSFPNHRTNVEYVPVNDYEFMNKRAFVLKSKRSGYYVKITTEITLINDTDINSMADLFEVININPEIVLYPHDGTIFYRVKCVSDVSHIDIHDKLRVGQRFKLEFKETSISSTIVYEA